MSLVYTSVGNYRFRHFEILDSGASALLDKCPEHVKGGLALVHGHQVASIVDCPELEEAR